jgi:hypothetical protein
MRKVESGRRPGIVAVTRNGAAATALLLALALSACTTVEGTNALTDPVTFEREVMTSTLQGLALVPKEEKPENVERRGPLVMPKAGSTAPAPQPETQLAELPKDSDTVRIDTTNLSEADLARLRNARVVDLRSLSGRPLTDAEARQLTARMNAANIANRANTKKPLYFPPDEYFVTVGGRDLICRTSSGDLVRVDDPKCPPQVRKALSLQSQVKGGGGLSPTQSLSDDLGLDNHGL